MDGGGMQAAAADNKGAGESAAAAAGVTLEELRKRMADFAKERDWDQFHSPRNLLLAMVGEVGELSEIFQWKGEVPKGLPGWEAWETEHLGEELADVLLYLVRLSDMCGIDLGKAALRKIGLNTIKHPIGQRHNTASKKFSRCSGDDGKADGDKNAAGSKDDEEN
ncbi:unnamed protein product [Urochloa decumbens]|uniref:dCTP pyrophosphatase 1 n=1 Tax=Urochloa decumbens TaxID=240449 RepID=A0ABC9CYQ6_9POAL